MNQHQKHRRGLKHLLRDERGVVAIYMTVCLPVFVGLLILVADGANLLRTRNLLQVTADSAALYAANQLPNASNVTAAAQKYANINMPSQIYGSVLASGDVKLGYWPGTCTSKTSCLQTCSLPPTSTPCNAVQVTTRYTPKLFFASALRWTGFNESATATATFGYGTGAPGSGLPPTWNAVVAQDISGSFKNSIKNAQAADQALLTCMDQTAGSGSQFGLTLFTGDPPKNASASLEDPALTNVANNYTTLQKDINSYGDCGTGSMPACSGTDIAAGIIDGINQFTSSTYQKNLTPGSQPNIIIVSDGQPNSCSYTTSTTSYTKKYCPTQCDGTGGGCSGGQSPSNAATAAANQAAADGINVFVIYYCSSGCNNADQTYMDSLVRGQGIALNEPNASNLAADMQQFCASQAARLVW